MAPQFRNAQHAAHRHPDSFEAPTAEELAQVGPGNWVKLSVAFPESEDGMDGERFWTEVTERHGDQLVGRVDNELVATRDHGLARNDRIEFSIEHVYDVHL